LLQLPAEFPSVLVPLSSDDRKECGTESFSWRRSGDDGSSEETYFI
ncbi:hypothetical protein Tco_1181429, partial [Tanacetum coccineum]